MRRNYERTERGSLCATVHRISSGMRLVYTYTPYVIGFYSPVEVFPELHFAEGLSHMQCALCVTRCSFHLPLINICAI